MITLDQLNPKHYANECWFNIYSGYQKGFCYSNAMSAEEAAFYSKNKVLYRIHVRLK